MGDMGTFLRNGELLDILGKTEGRRMSTVAAIIPARYSASRLPGKPLLRETGKTLVQHVYEAVRDCPAVDRTLVATDDPRIEEAVRASGADEFVSSLPEGLETVVGERGIRLSGGQKQRIALARALLKDAPVLILDEATSAVDGATESRIKDALRRVTAGRTVLVVAHRLSTISTADRIVVLEAGQVVETGTYEELTSADGAFARLCRIREDVGW